MGREIKFRVWDTEKGGWYQGGAGGDVITEGHFTLTPDTRCVLMQFTGLKDKNGVEIYEGDVCQIPENNVLAVIVFEEEQAGFFAQIKSFDEILSARIDQPAKRGIEVIGNIYENPELIEKNV